MRTRRRAVWRSHWRLWVEWAVGFGLLLAALAVLEAGHPQARAALLGAVATAAIGTLLFGLTLVDGSLLARLGRMAEESIGDELRTAAGVYGVVSNLPFDLSDVDHVVLAHAGVLAVEVKQVHGLRRGLPPARLAGMVDQARAGGRRTAAVLRQSGVPVPVWPVLVLTGAGAPDLPDGRQLIDGVTVVAWRDSAQWLPRLAAETRLSPAAARRASDGLLAFRARRWQHNRQHRPPAHTARPPGAGTGRSHRARRQISSAAAAASSHATGAPASSASSTHSSQAGSSETRRRNRAIDSR